MARYSDTQLIQIIQKAARRINRRLKLVGTDSEIVISSSTGEFTSPSDADLEDMVLLQAECMISATDFQSDLSDGVAGVLVVDGEQRIDTRGSSIARGTFYDSPHSPCAELEKAIVNESLCRQNSQLGIW